MNNLEYEVFYRRAGVKLEQQLITPPVININKFQFPKDSIHHFVDFDSVNNGPASDFYYYREIEKKILVTHVTDMSSFQGEPRKLTVPVIPYIRAFHVANKRFRYLEKIEDDRLDHTALITVNYGIVAKMYRYTRNIFSEYNKWWNIEKTVWDQIAKISAISNRQHFVFLNLPERLPSMVTLEASSKNFNQTSLKLLNSHEALFILELWKLFSVENKDKSVFSGLSEESLKKINLVFQESDKFVLINLGLLYSWIYVKEDSENTNTQKQSIRISPLQMQKRFLMMLIRLMEERSVTAPTEPTPEDFEEDEAHRDSSINPSLPSEITDPNLVNQKLVDADKIDSTFTDDSKISDAKKRLQVMDDVLKQLEIIENKSSIAVDDNVGKNSESKTHSDKTVDFKLFETIDSPEEVIVELCDSLAEDGIITANDYRRFTRASKNYENIVSPDGQTPLGEYIKIQPEQLQITESSKMVDKPTILDKSMLSSSLLDFDERYIKNILNKDICSMPVAMQKAGFIINKYETETIEDVLGSYEIHTLRITPIEGMPSTLRFKIPVVNDDGVYMANGIKYRMRKQRGDLPIRKTAPDRVALTSYYGKTFVTRSDKKVNDYASWLRATIIQRGIDQSDSSVTNLFPADVFDNLLDVPRIYSIISNGIKSFSSKGYTLSFDYKDREKIFDKEVLERYEKNGSILIGYNALNNVIVMDKFGSLHEGVDGNLRSLGSLESFIGIDVSDAPVDFAQVKIYGKNIPIGIVLGYKYGLSNLLEMLKADVRRVQAGQRLNLQEHEYTITFSDETLILSKDDELATMILAGFKEYHRSIKHYSVYTFDKPNVYLNVLESNSISSRYLREIDLLDKLFVDPITKDLLIEMNEPTNFRGLLVRSSELLLKDSHPDTLDMQYMRIKGYERFAGAVYSELVNSVREHKSKPGKRNAQIELHPYSVWKRIAQDPSINLVSDINPIENLKQVEAVTYSGVGGRISRSMTKTSRAYHPNDMGVISEATTDSSDVAINVSLSADPQFKSLRGTTKKYDPNTTGTTALLSTSAVLSVASVQDD